MKKIILFLLLCSSLKMRAQQTYDGVIDSLYQPDQPGGVALVAQQGKILYERAFGMADLELDVKMQTQMLFEIGSMTKQFTSACILQLADGGKLKLDDPICNYIDNCPPYWKGIRIEHLLTHTSGITDVTMPEASLNSILKIYDNKPLSFAPGSKRSYSNIGYALLGYIIEKVTGESYQDYLQKNILNPLGLAHTVYGNTAKIISGRVPCYLRSKNGKTFQNVVFNLQPSAAGALLSNARDLCRWNQALISGQVISKTSLQKAWTSYHLTDGTNTHYGYGWQTDGRVQGSPVIEHGGVAVGYLTDALYMPKEDIYVVVLSNQRGTLPEIVAAKLAAIAIGKPDTMHAIPASDEVLKSYAGTYLEQSDTIPRMISLVDHHLYYQRSGGPRMEMKPYSTDHFFFDNTSVTGTFTKDAKGRIINLSLFELRHPDEPTQIFQKQE